jgi:hypothetical protein
MRSPKRNTRATKTAAGVSASHHKRPCRDHYSDIDPSASVTVGRETIGYLIDEPGQCVALSIDRTLIGTFPNRIAAMAAIKIPDQREAATPRKAARR